MRLVLQVLLILTLSSSSFGQNDDYMLWTKIGAKGQISDKMSWAGELNTRIGGFGVETFFPQFGVEYKPLKWLRPSIEYRFIVDRNKYGNYKASNRLNFNVNFKKDVSKLSIGFRLRYQYAFNSFSRPEYNPDFDVAFRFKPSVEYKIDNSIFTPFAAVEFFYDPTYSPIGPDFSKFRLGLGTKVNLKGPNTLSIKYQLDNKFHDFEDQIRHVIALSYSYKIKGK
ncbi:MAG: DUF2490 domain-containing protein [Fluviicola sp.]|nr:DUF2490 domain-containing protein [Fluviicola sp.]